MIQPLQNKEILTFSEPGNLLNTFNTYDLRIFKFSPK